MKANKPLALLLTLMMILTLAAGITPAAFADDAKDKTELIVFAAASMTETLTELKDKYEKANPDVTITYNFDSSGTLKTQIQEGADCDLFISVFLAMGNSDVPVGQYTQKILAFYELNEEELAKAGLLTYGTNVKEVTTQVKEASVDCGVVYGTDAFSAGLEVVDTATKEMCGQVIYPAAVLNVSKHPEAAQAFLDYLAGEEATEVFEGVGFSPMSK